MNWATVVWILVGLGLGMVGVFSAAVYSGLPDRIPTHFGPNGQPDAFGSKSSFWLLPILAVVMCGIGFAISRWMYVYPQLLNIPYKERLLKMEPAAQKRILARAEGHLAALFLIMVAFFGYLQLITYQVAKGYSEGAGVGWGFTALLLLQTAWMVWDLRQQLRPQRTR